MNIVFLHRKKEFCKKYGKSSTCFRTSFKCRTNYCYLSSPEKVECLYDMCRQQKCTVVQLTHLKVCLQEVIINKGVQMDDSLQSNLRQIVVENENQLDTLAPANSFQWLFWDQ